MRPGEPKCDFCGPKNVFSTTIKTAIEMTSCARGPMLEMTYRNPASKYSHSSHK